MDITDEMIKQSYIVAKKVYDKKMSFSDGARILTEQYNMNDASAKDYINDYRYLRIGQQYTRTMKGEATDYFLQNIFNESGFNALQTALQAVDLHIVYYESLNRGRLNNIRKIYKEYKDIKEEGSYNEYHEEEEKNFLEGKAESIFINRYERDKNARQKCLEHYGYNCFVCGTKLSDLYGEVANKFIHVHHIIELSAIKKEYIVDPINDLRPLCPNCHAIIHRRTPAFSINDVKNMLKK